MSSTAVSTRAPAARQGRGGTAGAIGAEWTKLWSVRATWWCLIGSAALMALFAPGLGVSMANSNRSDNVDTDIAIAHPMVLAVNMVQFAVIALAMLAITTEYSTGSIRTTLQCVPVRGRMLFAKSAVAAPVMFVVGTLLALVGTVTTAPLLFEYADADLGKAVPTIVCTGVYIALMGVFSIGIGAAIRSAVGTLTTVFMILAGLPGALALSSSDFTKKILDYLPSTAGQHLMDGDTEPYGRMGALLVVLVWVAASQIAGYIVLRKRDA
ncbi:ABC transporter permease [Streptomyces violaceorubidus]|uniref:ABC transporter permease n=1 Tax=Streptomyces violaceorubidus TaxID=284042 RepID=A0ABV1T2P6_9ACTN|nr:ABC transporter permease [Streptomyces violaceorubidus]